MWAHVRHGQGAGREDATQHLKLAGAPLPGHTFFQCVLTLSRWKALINLKGSHHAYLDGHPSYLPYSAAAGESSQLG